MFVSAPPEVLKSLKERKISFNSHEKCVTVKKFWENKGISGSFNLLSTNKDRNGLEFISTIEGKTYPFFATQWHPEKPLFEWTTESEIDHSPDNIRIGQYLANFFVDQARCNSHKFAGIEEEKKALIYINNPTDSSRFTGFQQCYFFN